MPSSSVQSLPPQILSALVEAADAVQLGPCSTCTTALRSGHQSEHRDLRGPGTSNERRQIEGHSFDQRQNLRFDLLCLWKKSPPALHARVIVANGARSRRTPVSRLEGHTDD